MFEYFDVLYSVYQGAVLTVGLPKRGMAKQTHDAMLFDKYSYQYSVSWRSQNNLGNFLRYVKPLQLIYSVTIITLHQSQIHVFHSFENWLRTCQLSYEKFVDQVMKTLDWLLPRKALTKEFVCMIWNRKKWMTYRT